MSNFLLFSRYGFHREHCVAALKEDEGDVGLALEHLLMKCYSEDGSPAKDETSHREDVTMDVALEQRQDEALALSSIYSEDFEEKIPNKLWAIQFDLDHINDILEKMKKSTEKSTVRYNPKQQEVEIDPKSVCPFYLKGDCRYGSRCWKAHVVPFGKDRTTVDGTAVEEEIAGKPYELEIRFPDGNLYPYEAPLIAFSSKTSRFPIVKCLNISKHLYHESKTFTEEGEPAIFSLVSILEDETQMQDVLQQQRLKISMPKKLENQNKHPKFVKQTKKQKGSDGASKAYTERSSRTGGASKGGGDVKPNEDIQDDDDNGEESSSSSSDEEVPTTPEKPGKIFVFPRQDQKVIDRDNRTLRENFRKKQVSESKGISCDKLLRQSF